LIDSCQSSIDHYSGEFGVFAAHPYGGHLQAVVAALDRTIHLKMSNDNSDYALGWNADNMQEHCHDLNSLPVEDAYLAILEAATEDKPSFSPQPPTNK
jgi:hypothetical protein